MKKLLILIVAFALFLHFYPQPELEQWYGEQKGAALDGFSDTFDTQARISPKKILIDLNRDMKNFTPKELKKLNEIVVSRREVKAFYSDYCQAKKRQFIFRPSVQGKICKTISKYTNLL